MSEDGTMDPEKCYHIPSIHLYVCRTIYLLFVHTVAPKNVITSEMFPSSSSHGISLLPFRNIYAFMQDRYTLK